MPPTLRNIEGTALGKVAELLYEAGEWAFWIVLLVLIFGDTFRLVAGELSGPLFFIMLLLLVLSSPIVLFSASVGMWRHWAEEDGNPVAGAVAGVVLFAKGLAHLLIPLSVLVYCVEPFGA